MPEVGSVGSGNLPPSLPVEKGGAAPGGSTFRPGDRVQVEVQQVNTRGEGVLRLGGQLLRAVFPGDLPQGARLAMQVVAAGPPLVLRRAEDAGSGDFDRLLKPPAQSLSSALSVLLKADTPEGPEAELLRAARALLQLPREPAALARSLAAWVGGSGIHHETALARGLSPVDLKTFLLQLVTRLSEGPLKDAAESLLGHLQAHQARSALQDQIVLPLVLPWGEEWIQGEIRLDPERRRRGEGSDGGGALRLHLHMPQLGRVEVSVRWTPTGVSIRLGAEARSLESIRDGLDELSRHLRRSGGVRLVDLRAEPLSVPVSGEGKGLVEVIA